jgi:neutral ceramidase
MFMIGCGADANPVSWCGSQPEKAEEFGKQLAAAVDRALAKKPLPLSGPLAVAFQRVDLPFANPMTREQIEKRRGKGNRHEQAETEFLLQYIAKNGFAPRAYPCPVQVVQFGRDVSFVAISGETCVGYALRLREELKGQRIWVAGYCNEVFAYVPTEQILKEGGYEAGASYGWPSPFQAGIEDRIITLAKKLVAQCVQVAQ